MNRQSILRRKPKADVAKEFVGVLSRDNDGRAKTLVVPGSQGKRYHVILRRPGGNVITTECAVDTPAGHIRCKGNSITRTICYHSRAAIDYAVREAGYNGAWCASKEDQLRLMHLYKSPVPVTVRSHQNGVEAYLVVSKGAV